MRVLNLYLIGAGISSPWQKRAAIIDHQAKRWSFASSRSLAALIKWGAKYASVSLFMQATSVFPAIAPLSGVIGMRIWASGVFRLHHIVLAAGTPSFTSQPDDDCVVAVLIFISQASCLSHSRPNLAPVDANVARSRKTFPANLSTHWTSLVAYEC